MSVTDSRNHGFRKKEGEGCAIFDGPTGGLGSLNGVCGELEGSLGGI